MTALNLAGIGLAVFCGALAVLNHVTNRIAKRDKPKEPTP